jgi:hypothetical protein
MYSENPEIYKAPALPLGRDFSGIVYLHGSVELDRHQSPYGMIDSVARFLAALAKRQDLPLAVVDQMEEYTLRLWDIGTAVEISSQDEALDINLGTMAGQVSGYWA